MMIMMESIGCYGVKEEEGGRRRKERKERAWYLLQAKPRLLIGWRDRAGFLASASESRISEARLRTSSPSLKKTVRKPWLYLARLRQFLRHGEITVRGYLNAANSLHFIIHGR